MDRYPSILLSFVIAVVPIFTVALGDDVVMFSFSSPISSLPYNVIDGSVTSK